MKPLLLALALLLTSMAAFGQGKVQLNNDSVHLVYFNPDPLSLKPGDAPLAGQGVPSTPTPEGETFLTGLYGGTSAISLTLQATTTFSSFGPGRLSATNVVLTGIPGGSPAYFQVRVWDGAYTDPDTAILAGGYFGQSPIFQTTPGASIAYASIVTHGGFPASTWADGTYNMDSEFAGARGAIMIGIVPEPSSLGLIGLGAAVLVGLRRPSKRF